MLIESGLTHTLENAGLRVLRENFRSIVGQAAGFL